MIKRGGENASALVLSEVWIFSFRYCAESAVAGAAAGSVVETVLYPIDTIKTRLQAGCFIQFACLLFKTSVYICSHVCVS